MAKKKAESLYVSHCGLMFPVKNSKATCLKCHSTFEDGKWSKPEKRSFYKKSAGRGRNGGDMVFDLGLLLLIIPLGLWLNGLLKNGLQSFRMDVFTLVVILALTGFAMVGGFGNGKKA